jgi:hypothetical protein
MALRRLFVREDETVADAQRRDDIEAPFGRCGDNLRPTEMYGGCGTPLVNDDYYTCPDFPDCCRP